MAICVHCGRPLRCVCEGEQPLGTVLSPCPLSEGALWIHVLDDASEPVEGAAVNKFSNWVTTDKTGLVKLNALPPKPYTAEIGYPIPPRYDAPPAMSKPVNVVGGQVAY